MKYILLTIHSVVSVNYSHFPLLNTISKQANSRKLWSSINIKFKIPKKCNQYQLGDTDQDECISFSLAQENNPQMEMCHTLSLLPILTWVSWHNHSFWFIHDWYWGWNYWYIMSWLTLHYLHAFGSNQHMLF